MAANLQIDSNTNFKSNFSDDILITYQSYC